MSDRIRRVNVFDEILTEIKYLYIDCPECTGIEDDQYFCTTCGCQGGEGAVNVLDWCLENADKISYREKSY